MAIPAVATLGLVGAPATQANMPQTVSASASGGALPAGAVVAFFTACPSGWANYSNAAGRFIVGTGAGYGLGSTGGAAQVTLTIDQMPSHRHEMPFSEQNSRSTSQRTSKYGVSTNGYAHAFSVVQHRKDMGGNPSRDWLMPWSSTEGKSQPFDNRPPYLALNYCYKL